MTSLLYQDFVSDLTDRGEDHEQDWRPKGRPIGSTASDRTESGLRFGQEAVIDYLLLHPMATQRELAAHFGRSPQYMQILLGSDDFKHELLARRRAISEVVERTTITRLRDLADRSIDKMEERIRRDPNLPMGEVRETCSMALKALGYGAPMPQNPYASSHVQVNVISKEALEDARSLMRLRRTDPGSGTLGSENPETPILHQDGEDDGDPVRGDQS